MDTLADALVREAKRASHLWEDGIRFRQLRHVEWLALLQHMGTKTPLLDVTSDPAVALYFATKRQDRDGLLIAWNARNWRDATEDAKDYGALVQDLKLQRNVAWLIPPVMAQRIVVQRSRLLVVPIEFDREAHWTGPIGDIMLPALPNPWNARGLGSLFAEAGPGRRAMPAVVGFRVPRDIKGFLRQVLASSYGITRDSLFPEPAGFSSFA